MQKGIFLIQERKEKTTWKLMYITTLVRHIMEFLCMDDVCNFRQTCKKFLEDDNTFKRIWQNEFVSHKKYLQHTRYHDLVGFSFAPIVGRHHCPFGLSGWDLSQGKVHYITIGIPFDTCTLEDGRKKAKIIHSKVM